MIGNIRTITLILLNALNVTLSIASENPHKWDSIVQANEELHLIYNPNSKQLTIGENRQDWLLDNRFAATPMLIGNYIYFYDIKSHPDGNPLKLYNPRDNLRLSGVLPVDLRDYISHSTQSIRFSNDNWLVQGFSRFSDSSQDWDVSYYLIKPVDDELHVALLAEGEGRGFWAYLREDRLAFRSLETDDVKKVIIPTDDAFQRIDVSKVSEEEW